MTKQELIDLLLSLKYYRDWYGSSIYERSFNLLNSVGLTSLTKRCFEKNVNFNINYNENTFSVVLTGGCVKFIDVNNELEFTDYKILKEYLNNNFLRMQYYDIGLSRHAVINYTKNNNLEKMMELIQLAYSKNHLRIFYVDISEDSHYISNIEMPYVNADCIDYLFEKRIPIDVFIECESSRHRIFISYHDDKTHKISMNTRARLTPCEVDAINEFKIFTLI